MCGIITVVDKKNFLSDLDNTGRKMVKKINHRGPDKQGYYTEPGSNIFLGHARLKVLDLTSKADQPMIYENLIMVYNGEIYNYARIKSILRKRGYNFKSNSDSEVILKGWFEWGEKLLNKLRGIFSFVIYDKKSRKLFVARDHLGVKPLYYLNTANFFCITSEIKSLKILSDLQLDRENLPEYFAYRFIQPPDTLFKHVKCMLPGYYGIFDLNNNSFKNTEYWDIKKNDEFSSFNLQETNEYFEYLFTNIIEEQCVSDVPLGILLSGGIDSATISLYLNKFYDSKTINSIAYTVDFDDKRFSEKEFVDQIKDKFNLKINSFTFSDELVLHSLKTSNYFLDEPVSQPHTPYFYLISQKIKEKLTVVLSGEGADEVFAGYGRYAQIKKFTNDKEYINFSLKSTRFLKSSVISKILNMDEDLVEYSVTKKRKKLLDHYGKHFDGLSLVQIVDSRTYLLSLLNRIDKTTMAFGVEARVPFLDHRLVSFGCNLPESIKLKKINNRVITKAFMKSNISRVFNDSFSFRKKVGFHTPFKKWLINSYRIKKVINSENEDLNTQFVNSELNRLLDGDNDYQCSDVSWIVYNLNEFINQNEIY